MKQADQIQRFLFDEHPVRGELVSLDSSWQAIIAQSKLEGVACTLLGHALAAATLLVETLKIDGSVCLQIRGDGPIHLLVAEATSKHTIRGILRQSRDPDNESSLRDIFNTDKLVITIKHSRGKPHQGIVALTGNSIASALQTYFDHSEQLPTRLWFAADQKSCCGMLLQKLPAEVTDDDAWNRFIKLAETITDHELLELDRENLLHRLFHQEALRLFDPASISFACTCSRERSQQMLSSLGRDEVESLMLESSNVEIHCEFCNTLYIFDSVDLEHLLSSPDFLPTSQTKH